MRAVLFVVGVALAAGAETQPDLGRLIAQAVTGLGLIALALLRQPDNEVN